MVERAKALSLELTYIRKDGSRFTTVASVTAMRDAQNLIMGYLLIGADNTPSWDLLSASIRANPHQRLSKNAAPTRFCKPAGICWS